MSDVGFIDKAEGGGYTENAENDNKQADFQAIFPDGRNQKRRNEE